MYWYSIIGRFHVKVLVIGRYVSVLHKWALSCVGTHELGVFRCWYSVIGRFHVSVLHIWAYSCILIHKWTFSCIVTA